MLQKQTSEPKEVTKLMKGTTTLVPSQQPCQKLCPVCPQKLQSWGPLQQVKPFMESCPVGHHTSSFSCMQSMRKAGKKCLSTETIKVLLRELGN